MLQSQLCNPTGILDAANSTVQKYKGRGCCQLNCAIMLSLIMYIYIYVCGRGNYVGRNMARGTGTSTTSVRACNS